MGLLFAKFYIRKMDEQSMSLNYNGSFIRLGLNEQYQASGEEFINIRYKGNKIEMTYGDEDSIIFTIRDELLVFTVLKGREKSTMGITVDYTWLHNFKGVHITVKEELTRYDD
jgi:hypothetical protein